MIYLTKCYSHYISWITQLTNLPTHALEVYGWSPLSLRPPALRFRLLGGNLCAALVEVPFWTVRLKQWEPGTPRDLNMAISCVHFPWFRKMIIYMMDPWWIINHEWSPPGVGWTLSHAAHFVICFQENANLFKRNVFKKQPLYRHPKSFSGQQLGCYSSQQLQNTFWDVFGDLLDSIRWLRTVGIWSTISKNLVFHQTLSWKML